MAYFINTHDDTHVYFSNKAWNETDKEISKAEYERLSKKNAIKDLKKLIGKNYQIYTVLRHVSQSGMQRRISCFIAYKNEIVNIDWYIERILTRKRHKDGGIVCNGCGMDMGFDLVYNLSAALYTRGKKYNRDAAYKLSQKWI